MARIGVIGVGIIGGYVITGFCEKGEQHELFLSPRNAKNAADLAAKYNNITVCGSNAEVCEKSEWIFVAVLPQLGREVYSDISDVITPQHRVINVVMGMKLDEIREIIGETGLLCHIVPLPFVREGYGPIVVYPQNDEAEKLLSQVGEPVFTKDLDEARMLQALTGVMSAFNAMLAEFIRYLTERNMSEEAARRYTTSFFGALCKQAASYPGDLMELALEATPGGLNEQALRHITENGGIQLWVDMVDTMLRRLTK